jgi:predicted DNA binding protein
MVQTTSFALFCLLVAPTLAAPITNEQHARAEDFEERDPGRFKSAVRKVANPSKLVKAGKFAAAALLREDTEEISQRDLESPESFESLITRDEFQFTEREVEYLKDLTARDPSWLKSAFRAVKKHATPPNLMKAGKFAAGLFLREDAEEISLRDVEHPGSVAIRDGEFQFTERDIEFLQDLTARDPSWFKSVFRAAKKHLTPSNVMKAGKFAAGVLFREDAEEISERDLEYPESIVIREAEFELTEREIEYLKDLTARDPSWLKSALRAGKKHLTPSNVMKAGKFAASVLFREDAEELSQRDVEYEDLSTREPSIKSFFERVKEVFSPKKKAKQSKSDEVEGREDDDDVFERYFDDYEIDNLD